MASDLNVETALLAAIYRDSDTLFDVVDKIASGDFADKAHGLIYEVLRERILSDTPQDIVSIVAEMGTRGSLEKAGGGEAVRQIIESNTGDCASASHYADLISEASKRRKITQLGQKLAQEAKDGGDLKAIGSSLNRAVTELSGNGTRFISPISVSAEELRTRLHAIGSGELSVDLIKSGFRDLDEIIKGLRPGQLVLMGARPGMGKTAFGLELALRAALNESRRVLFFSLEMSIEELTERAMAALARLALPRLQMGGLDSEEVSRVDQAVTKLQKAALIFNADPMMQVGDIRVEALKEKARDRLELIVVDYLQLMSGSARFRSSDNRQAEVAEISRSLKLLARELELPIIALSQLSRNLESRHDKRPQLSDLRESGSLEQDADLVMFLHREEVYDERSPNKGLVEVIVAKHRNGPTGKVSLWFDPEKMHFGDLHDIHSVDSEMTIGESAVVALSSPSDDHSTDLWGGEEVAN